MLIYTMMVAYVQAAAQLDKYGCSVAQILVKYEGSLYIYSNQKIAKPGGLKSKATQNGTVTWSVKSDE